MRGHRGSFTLGGNKLSTLIDLTKKAGIVLEKKNIANIKANIVVAIDSSGSMGSRYSNGNVQETVTRLLAIGMNMDVDKSIDVYTFNGSSRYVGIADKNNYAKFVEDNRIYANGGTKYSPVMEDIINKFGTSIAPVRTVQEVKPKGLIGKLFGKTEEVITETYESAKPVEVPTIVFFITDGENWDFDRTVQVIQEASKQAIFWQFVGIGNEKFKFLKKLDTMEGRYIDNANFFEVNDISTVSEEELYNRLLNELPSWLEEAKAKGLIR